jgi:geranylgeranyl diphosphate synthase type I
VLLLDWSNALSESSGLPLLAAGRRALAEMRQEVLSGQFLDMLPGADPERVIELKTAGYTVLRPCQFGATLGNAPASLLAGLESYGLPLGRAFQLRDDVLGLFGDPDVTGKPAGDDLRQAKHTPLLTDALASATDSQRQAILAATVAGASGAEVQAGLDAIQATGARDRAERRIAAELASALNSLARLEITPSGRAGLEALADAVVNRDS